LNPPSRNILKGCGALSVIGMILGVGACAVVIGTSGGGSDSAVEEPGSELNGDAQ
jgi:hypothetical protein